MGSYATKEKPYYRRKAGHAGSWYQNGADQLDTTLNGLLQDSQNKKTPSSDSIAAFPLRALLVPHAGYSYSGPTAAYAYQALKNELIRTGGSPVQTILVLHPSHHVYLSGCAVSGATHLATPLGDLTVNDALRKELLHLSPDFSIMSQADDETEHSGEMQYPYLAKVLRDTNKVATVSVLPVMCGALSEGNEKSYGKALRQIIARPEVCTVISSDFCHWGKRFSYQPFPSTQDQSTMKVHEFIEQMDRKGMDLIQLKKPGGFAEYLKETRNTICGRHAISVWLNAVSFADDCGQSLQVNFLKYDQSSAAISKRDSSVSYVAAAVTSTG